MINGNTTEEKLKKGWIKGARQEVNHPVPHEEKILYLRRTMRLFGLEPGRVEIGVTADRLDMVCTIEVTGGHDLELEEGQRLWFGLVSGNSRQRGSRMYAGVAVKGAPVSLVRTKILHRHTPNFQLPQVTHDAIQELIAKIIDLPRVLARMRAKTYPAARVDRVFIRAARRRLVAWSKIKRLCAERDRIVKGREPDALDLCVCFARVIEGRAPITYGPRTDRLAQLYEFYSLVADKENLE